MIAVLAVMKRGIRAELRRHLVFVGTQLPVI